MSEGIKMGSAFQISFGSPILEGLATIGKFDGKHPSLACATAGNRVMLHDSKPREMTAGGATEAAVHYLNFNKLPTALSCGAVSKTKKSDCLIMGSATTVTAYNIETNSDVFYKEVADGVFTSAFGTLGTNPEPLVFVGGNCSVFGFDEEGTEKFWSVTGENVASLALMPWKKDAPNCLISGSEDYEIRVSDGLQNICVITEGDKVSMVTPSQQAGRFGYALANGTIGVYDQQERAWRFKSKSKASSMCFCDVDFDGVAEVICGWSTGKLEVRSESGSRRGECMFKETFGAPVSALLAADYRMENRAMPIVCTFDGEVRGLIAMETSVDEAVETKEKQLLESLMREKQQAQFDLKNLETQLELAKQQGQSTSQSSSSSVAPPHSVMLSPNTSVKVRLRPVTELKSIELTVSASDGAVIRGAVVAGELIFPKGDSAFYFAETPSNTLACPIALEKDAATDLSLSVLVGSELSDVYQVHDLKFKLPKFSMYVPVQELPKKPTGFVVAKIAERGGRFHAWVSTCFNTSSQSDGDFTSNFVSLRDGQCLQMTSSSSNGGEFIIRCDNMETCGDIIQDVGAFLGLTELESTADFPNEFDQFKDVLQRVEEFNSVRMKLTADMADSTQLVKALVIKAEDARILNDMRLMKKMYGSLYEVNRELMGEYMKRSNNHNELLSALKEVNTMIQKAGKLRMGQAKNRLINECRAAIKANNIHALFTIIKTGKSQ